QEQKRKNIAQKRLELDKAKEKRRKENPSSPVQNNQQHVRKRQQTVTPVLSQNTKRENHQRPLKKEQKQKTPPKQFNQRKLNKRTDKRGQQT
ncbi:TPA: CD3337/EF1877 family mobilome membrane protein, partial [Streptococcus pyogenes]